MPDKFCDAQISMFYCSVCVKEMPDMKLILSFTPFILMTYFQIKDIVMHFLLSLYLENLVSRYMQSKACTTSIFFQLSHLCDKSNVTSYIYKKKF